VVLRFFKDQNLREVAAALNINEPAAQRRVHRAVEKLRQFFMKRGIALSSGTITGAISANSVQAAPVALAKSVTLVAMTKGVAASGSTLTLIKGALKIMAWTKMKMAVVISVSVLLAAGTAIVTVDEIQEHRTYAWEIPTVYDPDNHSFGFDFSTHQVQVKRSIYPAFKVGMVDAGIAQIPMPDGAFEQTNYGHWTGIGLGVTLDDIVRTAYDAQKHEVIYLAKLPSKPLYDYISNLPRGTAQPLQELIKEKFGIVGKWETRETDILLLQLSDSNMQRLKPAESLMRSMNITNISAFDRANGTSRGEVFFDQTIASLVKHLWLENEFHLPIIDETGMTNRFDCIFKYPSWYNNGRPDPEKSAWEEALQNQLGLELVPARRLIKMLVVEKVK
jgi:uncharacterized protein (TIGR03435 family)